MRNGFAQKTGWVSAEDGLLAYDADHGGKIDGIGELFGNKKIVTNSEGKGAASTVTNQSSDGLTGFKELASYDDNVDGVINSNDAVYSRLQVWQDANGITDEGELARCA